jgi:hypothetical protein
MFDVSGCFLDKTPPGTARRSEEKIKIKKSEMVLGLAIRS